MKQITYNSNNQFFFIVLVLIMFLFGCNTFTEVELPPNQVNRNAIFEEKRTAEAAISDLYAFQRDEGILSGSISGLSESLSLYTDEYITYGEQSSDNFLFNTHNILPSTRKVKNFWDSSYNTIYNANSAIQGLEKSSITDKNFTARLLGEAYFMRALMHFYLGQLYGDIPYVTSTDYRTNQSISKNTIEEVNELILKDLEKAISLVPEDYVTVNRIRPNKNTVKALLCRLFLYNEQWENAQSISSEIIQSPFYDLQVPLDKVFLKDSPGTIWQLMSQDPGQNTKEGNNFILLSIGNRYSALNNVYVNAFESGDQRKDEWIGSLNSGGNLLYFPFKYKEDTYTSVSKEFSKVFRIAEIYLIRAEAFLRMGKLEEAQSDINRIRNRAGLTPITTLDPNVLETILIQERKSELFMEFGHRWFDLKRFSKAELVLSPIKSGWGESSYLLPIPETELGANPNLKPQNPGY